MGDVCRSLEPLPNALSDRDQETGERASERANFKRDKSTDDIVSHSRRQSYDVVDAQSTSPPSRSIGAAERMQHMWRCVHPTAEKDERMLYSSMDWRRRTDLSLGVQSVWRTAVILMFFCRRSSARTS